MTNWLKAIFINALLIMSTIGTVFGAYQLIFSFAQRSTIPLLASTIATGTVCYIFFFYIGRGGVARTSENLNTASAIVLHSALISLFYISSVPLATFYAAGIAGIGLALYLFWYSSFGRKTGLLSIGSKLPAFSLGQTSGELLWSSELAKPSLIIFFRGNWCPLCVAQVEEVVAQYQRLQALGVEVYFVSPQPQQESEKLAKRFSAPVNFCVDNDNAAARILGIDHPRGLPLGMEAMGYGADIVMPTVIILDQQGDIAYLDETDNYRVRPEPDIYFEVFEKMGLAEN